MITSHLQKDLLTHIEQALADLDLPVSPKTLYEPYKYALEMGGKRVRPLMALLACGLCGGETDKGLPAALAVEILHNFTLVHDDIMDSADTRRGQPSVFKKWDENTAILSGDVMFADSYKQLEYYAGQDFTKEDLFAMFSTFRKAVITVCEGQALDMEFVDRRSITLDEYIEMIAGKTSALLSAALEMGAIAAKGSSEDRHKLHTLGHELGIAFQIQDDYLDATADPEKFGKRPGGDIHEGKKTYLTILTLERASEQEQSFIQKVLDSHSPEDEEVQQVLDIMESHEVLQDVASEIESHYRKALNSLESFDDSDYKQELQQLIYFLKERDH